MDNIRMFLLKNKREDVELTVLNDVKNWWTGSGSNGTGAFDTYVPGTSRYMSRDRTSEVNYSESDIGVVYHSTSYMCSQRLADVINPRRRYPPMLLSSLFKLQSALLFHPAIPTSHHQGSRHPTPNSLPKQILIFLHIPSTRNHRVLHESTSGPLGRHEHAPDHDPLPAVSRRLYPP